MRKLALDIGTKTCGFAITDESSLIASGLELITFTENDFFQIFNKIKKYLDVYKIDGIVIGHPLRSNGTKSERTMLIENLAYKMKDMFNNLDIYLVNEYGTTIKSESILKSAGLSHKKVKKQKDKLSAVLILEEFLNYGGLKI